MMKKKLAFRVLLKQYIQTINQNNQKLATLYHYMINRTSGANDEALKGSKFKNLMSTPKV
jgi:hypothetical protein